MSYFEFTLVEREEYIEYLKKYMGKNEYKSVVIDSFIDLIRLATDVNLSIDEHLSAPVSMRLYSLLRDEIQSLKKTHQLFNIDVEVELDFINKIMKFLDCIFSLGLECREGVYSAGLISLTRWMQYYRNGKFSTPRGVIDAGWYDWFCKDSSLIGRTRKLFPIVEAVYLYGLFDPDNVYVFFKNNCPVEGGLYDSVSVCKRDESQDVLCWLTAKSGHTADKGVAKVVLRPNWEINVLPMEDRKGVRSIKKFFKSAEGRQIVQSMLEV